VAEQMVRMLADVGPVAVWVGGSVLGLLAALIGYIGIAMCATFRASDAAQRTIRYRMFRDLLELVRDIVRGHR
jgi:hypothetical protein